MKQLDKDILIHIENHRVISIKQAQGLFFRGQDYSYDKARKKLKLMETNGLLKSYINSVTKEKMYYVQDKISAHDNFVIDFYCKLVEKGCQDIEIKKQPQYLKGLIRPDAFFKFVFDGYEYFVLLEVDLNHLTQMPKFQLYEKLYRDGDLEKQLGVFPQIVIMGEGTIRYESKNFDVTYLPFDLSRDFNQVLGLIA